MKLRSLYSQLKGLLLEEDGQDLIEYALIVALVAFGATAGMQTIAQDINNAFGVIGNNLTSTIA